MVSVPVLSVQRRSMAPIFWMALSLLTITLWRLMLSAPLARLAVTITGSISGVSPTAKIGRASCRERGWMMEMAVAQERERPVTLRGRVERRDREDGHNRIRRRRE